jgi:hypothetical protein
VSIAAALSFMALRRIISLPHTPDSWAKAMALVTSLATRKPFSHSSGICHER